MEIKIDGEVYEVDDVSHETGDVALISSGRYEFYVATDSEIAGRLARQRWADMVEHDPTEFRAIVGEKSLVAWALGKPGGPGSTQVTSLEAWLDMFFHLPEEELASYDGEEKDIDSIDAELVDELGFTPTVAYRHN